MPLADQPALALTERNVIGRRSAFKLTMGGVVNLAIGMLHLVGFDLLTVNLKTWSGMNAAKQKSFQAAADKAIAWSTAEHLKRETELAEGFKKQGLDVYTPDVNAFRAYAQKVYLASDEAKAWPPGLLDKINALKS